MQYIKQEAAEVQTGAAAAGKKKPEFESVTMKDGRVLEFAGAADSSKKRNLLKEYELDAQGNLDHIRLDFRNGVTLKIKIPPSLLGQFAGHGALQKYGDELAGLKNEDGTPADVDDMVLAIEQLDEVIQKGEWSTRKEGDGMGGTSVLIKALIAFSGKTLEQIKAFLKDKDAKFKQALRHDDTKKSKVTGLSMAATVKQIEAEKLSKGTKVDTSTALDDLDAIG